MRILCLYQSKEYQQSQIIKILKDKESPVIFGLNKDVAAASLIYLHSKNDEKPEYLDIVTNIEFADVVISIKELLSSMHGLFC